MYNKSFVSLHVLLSLTLLIAAQTSSFGQAPLLSPASISIKSSDARTAVAFDADGDNDDDVIACYSLFPAVVFYENIDGQLGGGQLIEEVNISGTPVTADLDNDGDQDLIVPIIGTIGWYANLGNGNFGARQNLPVDIGYNPGKLFAADLDGDGDVDLASSSRYNSNVIWFENTGGGNFDSPSTVDGAALDANKVSGADLDNDGDIDLISSSGGDKHVSWYENLGGGSFGARQIITTMSGSTGPFDVSVADFDGDGWTDIVYSARFQDKIFWIKNISGSSFGSPTLLADGLSVLRMLPIDLDGDADADLLTKYDEEVVYFENDGSGNFSSEQIIFSGPLEVKALAIGHLNDDNDIDIIIGDERNLRQQINLGNGSFQPAEWIDFATRSPNTATLCDIDGDFDQDFICTGTKYNSLYIFRNAGERFEASQQFPMVGVEPTEVKVGDVNGDGSIDIVVLCLQTHSVEWLQNNGDGTFADPVEFISGTGLNFDLLELIDSDGDGYLEVLVGSSAGIYTLAYTGSGWGALSLIASLDVEDIEVTDLNDDGLADLLTVGGSGVSILENTGSSLGSPITIDPATPFIAGTTTDLNQNGLTDIVISSAFGALLGYLNQGDGTYNTVTLISPLSSSKVEIQAQDLNFDGFPELLVRDGSSLSLFENVGGGAFGAEQFLTAPTDTVLDFDLGDVDGDGDIDLATANFSEKYTAWFENTSAAPCLSPPVGLSQIVGSTFLALKWNAIEDAFGYQVSINRFVAGSPAGSKTVVSPSNSKTLNFALPPGDYSWRVRAGCPADTTDWSHFAGFSVPVLARSSSSTLAALAQGWQSFPNPANEVIHFQSAIAQDGVRLMIFDGLGQLVYQAPLQDDHYAVDISGWQNGIYYYSISGLNSIDRAESGAFVKN